jgi:hypothetical protein
MPKSSLAVTGRRHVRTMRGLVGCVAIAAVSTFCTPTSAQVGGPGCHLLMDQAACVACVKRNLPQTYDRQGSPQWCARRIGERKAQGLGREPLRWDKK